MKLLLGGSVLVLVGVVVWAALEWTIESVRSPEGRNLPPVFATVNVDTQETAPIRAKAVVWTTSTGPSGCRDVVERRKRDEKERLADLLSTAAFSRTDESANPCAPFHLGEVAHGTRVEILDEYAGMARVRILSGNLGDRVGYIEIDRLAGVASERAAE